MGGVERSDPLNVSRWAVGGWPRAVGPAQRKSVGGRLVALGMVLAGVERSLAVFG